MREAIARTVERKADPIEGRITIWGLKEWSLPSAFGEGTGYFRPQAAVSRTADFLANFAFIPRSLYVFYDGFTPTTATTGVSSLAFVDNSVSGTTWNSLYVATNSTLIEGYNWSMVMARTPPRTPYGALLSNFDVVYLDWPIDTMPSGQSTDAQDDRALLDQIEEALREEPDDPQETRLAPETARKAQNLIRSLEDVIVRLRLPKADVFSYDGSIRIVWQANDKVLKLIIPPKGNPYIFYQHGGRYDTKENPDRQSLISWLEWLKGDNIRLSQYSLIR